MFVEIILDIAKTINLDVIAEGVEKKRATQNSQRSPMQHVPRILLFQTCKM